MWVVVVAVVVVIKIMIVVVSSSSGNSRNDIDRSGWIDDNLGRRPGYKTQRLSSVHTVHTSVHTVHTYMCLLLF